MQDYRTLGQEALRIAKSQKIESKEDVFISIQLYQLVIDYYSKIRPMTPADIRDLANLHRIIGRKAFNESSYPMAVQYYQTAILWLQMDSFERSDNDYRTLILSFIDLSDAHMGLQNKPAADECISQAIWAFECIKEKNDQEKKLDIGNNTQAFYLHYQKITSTSRYLKSVQFKNNCHLFFMEKQTLSIEDQLADMMDQLTLGNQQTHSNDCSYRKLALDYLELAKGYIKNREVKNTCFTFTQAFKTLERIVDKKESDRSIMEELKFHIQSFNPATREDNFDSIFPQNEEVGMELG